MAPITKKLAFDRSFQRKLVRLLYQEPNLLPMYADDLSPVCFDSKIDRFVASVMLKAHAAGQTPTKTILTNEARKSRATGKLSQKDVALLGPFIGTLGTPVPDRSYILAEVTNWIRHQKVVNALLEMPDLLEKGDTESAVKRLRSVVEYDPSPSASTGSRIFSGAKARADRRTTAVKEGIPTGTALDNYLIHEGLPPKQLGVIIAPPGRGKSAFLVHLGKSAILEKGIPVLHITLELSEDVIADRYDAAFSHIPMNQLSTRGTGVVGTNEKLYAQYGDLLVVKEYPTNTLTVNGIRSLLKRLEAEAFYPKLLLIDYLDLMRPTQHYDDRYAELGVVTAEVRGLAGSENFPIWAPTQANRASLAKEDIGMEDVAESFQKVMIADVMVALAQTEDEAKNKKMRAILVKNRDGYSGITVDMRVDTATVSFKSV